MAGATSKTVSPRFRRALCEIPAGTPGPLARVQGRLAPPMRYRRERIIRTVTWEQAFGLIGERLRTLGNPHAAAFYTSGRTSNEAAFLYQLFAREFGTNNLPDCSNLCHEATSVGLPLSIGVGKGTVQLADFALTDAVFTFGHNPGSNHPRMLSTLREVARRGKPIVVFNPMRERGLERFRSPQHVSEMLTGRATDLATHYFQRASAPITRSCRV